MKTYRVIAGTGLASLLISLFLPLLKIYTLESESEITLFGLYNALFKYLFYHSKNDILLNFLLDNNIIIISILAYSISLVLGIASVAYHKLNIFAGTACTLTGLSWIVSFDISKFSLIKSLEISDANMISIGYGLYGILLVAIVFFTAYFLGGNVVKHKQFNAHMSKINSELKSLNDKVGRISNSLMNFEENYNRLNMALNDLKEDLDKLAFSLVRGKVESAYTVEDKLIVEIRNMGSLPIGWIEVLDIEPRPRGANLPSEKIKLQTEIAPGELQKFSYALKDIYGKVLTFDPIQNYTVKVLVGWTGSEISQEMVFKVFGGHLRAEVESVYATGSDLILNIKNVGLLPITQEKILSISPFPGMFANPNQNQIINSGEVKSLKFSLVDGTFVSGLLYTINLELSDGINTFALKFSFVP
ncbi:MAG: hypothetical protein H5T50_10225 [Nitrososphaeria archaeon]|nr:hypothetical protein [Nitrososphaeria archaeon]